ncbi:MAG: copper resistance protein CopC/CopD [Actinobacteria bacterium]|nr:copper resistance protein CopC/CopD [Actinomycetota bacterium]
MSATLPRRLALLTVASCAVIASVVGITSGTASAHNTLLSSDPSDGAALSVAPTQITWVFDKAVPLETMTVTLTDATGARSELAGSSHGAAGDAQVVTPLPALLPGPVSVRWRLVGPDGHPLTGRVDFTISTPPPTTVAATATTTPAVAAPTPTTTIPALVTESSLDQGDGAYSTPTLMRWVLRYASYLAIMAIVGILLTTAYVWSGAGGHPMLRRILSRSLFATAGLGFLQLLVVASDISGKAPWSSFGSIDAATTTDAGMAFAIRIVLALTMWLLLFQYRIVHADVYWTAISLPGLGLLATWAFAGHSRSMRWPAVGVAADVAHHAAAAAWIAGLAIVGWIVIPKTQADVLVPAVRRFSRVAAISVAILVLTGLVQTVRLVGNPFDLLDVNHGRFLVAKIVVLAAMLGIANANRRRVDHRLDDPNGVSRHTGVLRQAIVTEFAIGLIIVGITAAMVVSPPASNQTETGAPPTTDPLLYYIMS